MRLLYITNIPTPYRQRRFNILNGELKKRNVELEVIYLSATEPNRHWDIPPESFKYKYRILKGLHPTILGLYAHFNPGLIFRLLKKDYQYVIIGGMGSPSHWMSCFFASKDSVKVMSIESNLLSTERIKGFGFWLKRLLLGRMDAYQVTGSPQIRYIEFFLNKVNTLPVLTLPNLIDERLYIDESDRLRRNNTIRKRLGCLDDNTQLWILPARLVPIKGIIPFIKCMSGISSVRLFLLGDGILENEIDELISTYKLPVTRVGYVNTEEMLAYYAAADLFVLPSLKDPSPLSPIEALAAALPILVSSHIGNLEDVLVNEKNGWKFEPESNDEYLVNLLRNISKMSRNELRTMGQISRNVYHSRFDTISCINRYVRELTQIN